MRIVTFRRIKTFSDLHPDAELPLVHWYHTALACSWKHLNEVKSSFNHVDYVGNHRYVFNVKGNDYRLVVIISFNAQKIYIRFIGTHAEYDKIKDIKTI
ncbi:MAG: type II toxin-antitoxin system HigB family toxin [Flavobacteriales bacterium]